MVSNRKFKVPNCPQLHIFQKDTDYGSRSPSNERTTTTKMNEQQKPKNQIQNFSDFQPHKLRLQIVQIFQKT